ncbi:MAG: hypothetical protein ACLR23_16580 [Clostridia bacterium]
MLAFRSSLITARRGIPPAWVGKGQVKRFPETVRVPQIGWNRVQYRKPHPLTQGLGDGDYFYFVNSYYVIPEEDDVILGTTEYGQPLCSFVAKGQYRGVPVSHGKEWEGGLRLLRNFVRIAEEGSSYADETIDCMF